MNTRYAGFWVRAIANSIDSLVLILPSWIAWLLLVGIFSLIGVNPQESLDGQTLQLLITVLYVVVAFPYFVYGHFRWGTTFGKRVLSIYVVDAGSLQPITMKQSILRFFGYIASSLPMGAGYLMAAIHPQKRALHDMIAGTATVIR